MPDLNNAQVSCAEHPETAAELQYAVAECSWGPGRLHPGCHCPGKGLGDFHGTLWAGAGHQL